MHLEPDTGEVLVNMPTNLYVTAATIRRRTRLLDLDVEVEAVPTYYTWTFGDGERLETTDAGHPYPNMSTTHTYTQPGHYQVTLETTYTGSFRIAGDRTWIPIDGTVTIAGPPVTLEAYEARAVLVP
jgi:PKD repeat protein